ncbi:uncharacterized protein LOC108679739, partial [Hyalella azteca]|uniref:Uncharacterized protein LOC108679739 n=1 Tax=Hyalella azteca TaxID=294128 RepID=A0A8B7PCY1_HYAAZ
MDLKNFRTSLSHFCLQYNVGGAFNILKLTWTGKLKHITLTYRPRNVGSVIVTASSTLDVFPTFYHADVHSPYPSLQRLSHPITPGMHEFIDVVVSDTDTASLRSVTSVELTPHASPDSAHALPLPTASPRPNTFVILNDSSAMPQGPFSVVYSAQDSDGGELVRISQQLVKPSESRLSLNSGREVWGKPGTKLPVHFSLINTADSDDTFALSAADALGYSIRLPRR